MRLVFIVPFVLVAVALVSSRAENNNIYTAAAGAQHVGEFATVVGKVTEVRQSQAGHVFINLDGNYPNESFTIFVPSTAVDQIGNPQKLKDHQISVTGKIVIYRDKPEIVLNDSAQLKVRW